MPRSIRQICKAGPNGHPWTISETCALDVAAEQREAIYESAWQTGGLRFRAAFQDLLTNKEANETAAEFIRNKIRQIVKDPAVAAKLIPTDHPFAAKRPPIDTGYFETFNRDNVTLIDLRETPIERIIPEGIQQRDGSTHALDIIVFATGFDAMTGPLLKLDIRGRDGRSLRDAWADGPRTYLGLQVAGFPNLFTITGPGSPSVLCNMPVAIEQHVEWITECISHLRDQGITRIEPTEDAVERWIKHNNQAADATLLPQAGHSWYLGRQRAGQAAGVHAVRRRHGALCSRLCRHRGG